MTTKDKVARRKLSMLELAAELNNVSKACRTHLRRVSAVQPILPEIETIASHCEPYAPACSSTIRTARARTSGE